MHAGTSSPTIRACSVERPDVRHDISTALPARGAAIGDTAAMVRDALRGGVVVLASAVVAMAQQPAGPEWATLAERLRELPVERLDGTPQVLVLDWRTGAPLPDALVVALAAGDVPTTFLPGPVAPARLLARALEVGRRLAVAADGQVVVPAGALVVAVHGDRCAAGDEGVLAPEPHTPWPIELRGADGTLRPNHVFFGRRSDAHGRLAWPVWPAQRAGNRLLWIGADNLPGLGMLPPGGLVRDGHDASASPTVALLPATATLVLRGEHRGVAADLGHASVYRRAPFPRGGGGWAQRARGGEQVEIDDVPVGEALVVHCGEAVIDVPPLTAGERRLVVVPRSAPVPIVRYRLVDAGGRVLRGVSSHEGGTVLAGDAGALRVRCDEAMVFVRLFDAAGEEWSTAPFPPPQGLGPGVHDGGDLVLVPSSGTVYCRGRVYDATWQPVRTRVELGDGHGIWASAVSGDDGAFTMRIGPWFASPMGLHVRSHPLLTPLEAERGDDVVLVVDATRPVHATIAGELLGLAPVPLLGSVEVRAVGVGGTDGEVMTSLRSGGTFALRVAAGRYDVMVVNHGGEVLLAARDIAVGAGETVRPPGLRGPLPAGLQVVPLRCVDAAGLPWPVMALTQPATGRLQAIVPTQATTVVLPQLLRAVALPAAGAGAAGGGAPGGVVDVVVDIAFADVEVTGLPTASPWSFGLRIVGAGGDGRDARVGELVGGRGRMVVPRGVPLRAELLVQRFDAQGRSWWDAGSLEPLPGFVGAFVVPAAGVGGAATQVRFVAPVGLVEELARREAQR